VKIEVSKIKFLLFTGKRKTVNNDKTDIIAKKTPSVLDGLGLILK